MQKKADAYIKDLERVKGSTIAIVYIFEGEVALGFEHYHVWKGDVIANWLKAVQNLGCRPFILDVRTFVDKAMGGPLPHIDYVLNLKCGSCDLSPMGLVPSACAFLGIPCIPCDTVGIIAGEHKHLSNLIAANSNLLVPRTLPESSTSGIFRPLNYGSSHGVVTGYRPKSTKEGVYQEFIHGFDVTTPMVYDPLSDSFECLPTVLYLPSSGNLSWYFGESAKSTSVGYERRIIHNISDDLRQRYNTLCRSCSVHTYCRIDARIQCNDINRVEQILANPLSTEDLYFVEINTMPTVKDNNSFGYSFASITPEDTIFECIEVFRNYVQNGSAHSFLLATSMIAYLRSKC